MLRPRDDSAATSRAPTAGAAGPAPMRPQHASTIASVRPPAPAAVPPKDPFRTSRQLPRTPLSSKNGNGLGSRPPGSRARSASPAVTKIPRSSHFARSASPARTPAGPKTPRGRPSSSALATRQGSGTAGAAAAVGKGLPAVSTPVADTKRVEEEILAAFARTPKVARTPPKSSAPSPVVANAAAPGAAPAGELRAGALPTAELSTTAPARTAPPAQEQQPPRQLREDNHGSQSAAEAAASQQHPIGDRDATAAEPAAEPVFGKSAKLGRTPPCSDGVDRSAAIAELAVTNGQGQHSAAAGGAGAAAGGGTSELSDPRSLDNGSNNGETSDNGGNSTSSSADFQRLTDGEARGSRPEERQQRRVSGMPTAVLNASAAAAAAAASRGRTARPGLVKRGASPASFSPSTSLDSSCTVTANVRSLAGSASKTGDVAGASARSGGAQVGSAEFRGALTPAAFKGLTSVMRTPSTGINLRDGLVNEVPQMRPLDLASTNAAHRPAPRVAVPPRPKNPTASRRPRYASSIEEAKAAAEAAAAATAAKRAAAVAAAPAAASTDAAGPATGANEPSAEFGSMASAVCPPPAHTNASPSGLSSGAAVPVEALENGTGEADPSALSENDPTAQEAPLVPAPAQEAAAVLPSAPPGQDEEEPLAEEMSESQAASGDALGAELDGADPFVRSQKLARTPPPGAAMAAAGLASTAEAAARPAILPAASTVMDDSAGLHAGTQPEATAATKEAASRTSEPLDASRKGHESPAAACGNPFASRSNIPRTPTDQVAPLPQSLPHNNGAADAEGGDAEPVDAGEAQLRIGELRQELACMADRLAKQADERKRLADVAFEAQDEAIKLRQQLQDMQEAQSKKPHGDEDDAAAPEGNGGGGTTDDGAPNAIGGKEEDAATPPYATAVVEIEDRVLQLEIENWQTERSKQEAEKEAERAGEEARQAKAALEQAQAKVRDLAQSAEARYTEVLEERLRRDRERCQARERAIEEHSIKVKIFIAEKRAEIMRSRVSEEERVRAEQDVRAAAVAVAGKACKVVREFVARNERMSRRVAGLRVNVKEREERVSQLKEASARLETNGRCARSETETVRGQLAAAMEELEATKRSRQDLEERLGPLEKDCLEAQAAQERLRHLVDAEEARRVSVEQRLSEIKHHGDQVVGMERARRQSTERRLGLAERSRDELAAVAASTAGSALRKAAETEKTRRLSVERRLDYAERVRAELSETAAKSAAAAADAAASAAAAAASNAASKTASLERRAGGAADRTVHVNPAGAAPSAPLAEAGVPSPTPAPKKKAAEAKKAKVRREQSKSKRKSKAVAPSGGSAGEEERLSSVADKAAKRARAVGEAGRGDEKSPPAKVRRYTGANAKKPRKVTSRGDSARDKGITTSGVGKTTLSRGSASDAVRDKAPEVPVRGAPVPTGNTTAGGRVGRKRKPVNYAESSADLDSSDEDVAGAVRSHRAQGRRTSAGEKDATTGEKDATAGEKDATTKSRRSVIASLSDTSSDDESDGGIAGERTASRGKKEAALAAASRKNKAEATKAVGGAGMVEAGTVESASDEAARGGSNASAEEASSDGEGGGEGDGEAARSLPLSRPAEEGGAPDAISAVGVTRESSLSPAREELMKKKKRRPSVSKARKSRKAARDEGPGRKPSRSDEATAYDEEDSVPDKAVRRGDKAGRVGSVGPTKAVQKPTQVQKEPTPLANAKDLLSTDLSPIPPPAQKRPRKLLGAGTSRCKTPKTKRNTTVPGTISGDDTASPPPTAAAAAAAAAAGPTPPHAASADVVPSVPAVAPAAPVVATAVGSRSGVGPKSGAFRAKLSTVNEATGAVDPGARSSAGTALSGKGLGLGASDGGSTGAPAAKRALKPLKLSTNSILAMRGKSTMRTSMFKSFLDPKQGFKAPKLKPGASRS